MNELPSPSVPGASRGPRFQRRLSDEPSIFRRTITGRWLLKLKRYDPKIDGPAVERCSCKTCVPPTPFSDLGVALKKDGELNQDGVTA